MKVFLKKVMAGQNLSKAEAFDAMNLIINNEATSEQIAALLASLRVKGETSDELTGFIESILSFSDPLKVSGKTLIDNCGTGGDESGTFNISTATSFVLAAAGLGVAKHGNRSVSSQSGSADVLEKFGIPVDSSREIASEALSKTGFAFLFAPQYHPAIKNVASVRKAMGVRTVFNLMGPLLNPARVKHQVIGVFDSQFHQMMAQTLRSLGSKEVLLVTGKCGLDEASLSHSTVVTHLKNGKIRKYTLAPSDFGLKKATRDKLQGGDAQTNADIIRKVFEGETGPRRDVILMNAALGLVVGGIVKSIKEGVKLADELITKGQALEALEKVRNFYGTHRNS